MSNKIHTIQISEVYQGGKLCDSYSVHYINAQGLRIPCKVTDNTIKVEIDDALDQHCIDIIVQCDNCSKCPAQTFIYCFCEDNTECGDCQICEAGVCKDICTTGQQCLNGNTCVDCTDDTHCSNGQVCINGECVCSGATPHLNSQGICVECLPETTAPNCQTCVGGQWTATDCGTQYCLNSVCVDCINTGNCEENEICSNNICVCAQGFIFNPQTGLCEEAPDCVFDTDCAACETCVSGGCAPLVCPAGQECVNGVCLIPCTEGNDCPNGYGCLNGHCVPCNSLGCTPSTDCTFADGCGCITGSCQDITDECNPALAGVNWNYVQPTGTGTLLPSIGASAFLVIPNNPNLTGAIFAPYIDENVVGNWFYNPTTNQSTPLTPITLPSPLLQNVGTGQSVELYWGQSPWLNNTSYFTVTFEANDGRVVTYEAIPPSASNPIWTINIEHYSPSTNTVPGYWQLCSTNSDFSFTPPYLQNTNGPLTVSVTEVEGTCLNLNITGCGEWSANALMNCFGTNVSVPVTFSVPTDPCCDAQDPNCIAGPENCTLEEVTGVITITPLYENNQFAVSLTAPTLTNSELFGLNPSWTTTPIGQTNYIVFTPTGGSNTSGIMTTPRGGCLDFIGSSTCFNLTAQNCFDDCDLFDIQVTQNSEYEFTITSSLDTAITWSIIQGLSRVPAGIVTNQVSSTTITVDPNVANNQDIIIQGAYTGSCTRTATITVSPGAGAFPGCTDMNACNFDPNAQMDDGSCLYLPIATPIVDCAVLGTPLVLNIPNIETGDIIAIPTQPNTGSVYVDNFDNTITFTPDTTLTLGSATFYYTVTNSCGTSTAGISIHLVSSGTPTDQYYCPNQSTIMQLSEALENEAVGVTYHHGTCTNPTGAVNGATLNSITGEVVVSGATVNGRPLQFHVIDTQTGFPDCEDCTDVNLFEQSIVISPIVQEVCNKVTTTVDLNEIVTTNSPSGQNLWSNNNCTGNANNPEILTVSPEGIVSFHNANTGVYTFSVTTPCGSCHDIEISVFGGNSTATLDTYACDGGGGVVFSATFPSLSSGTTAIVLMNTQTVPTSDYTIDLSTGIISGATTVGVVTGTNVLSIQPITVCVGDSFKITGSIVC